MGRPPLLLWRLAFLGVLALVVVSSLVCDSDESGDHHGSAVESVDVAAGDAVVATVDGVPITASRVAELVKATGHPPRQVVERLIDFELLAAEARRRGLAEGHDVRAVGRQAMVQRYLAAEFEASHEPANVPESILEASYQQNRTTFVRPKLYKVTHILVKADVEHSDAAKRAGARRLAQEIYEAAQQVKSGDEFRGLAARFQGRQGFELTSEQLIVHERANLIKAFIDATLLLQEPGDVSEPVETRYGYHVIYLMETRAALSRSFAEAREEVRSKEYPFWIKREFFGLTERLRQATTVRGYSGPKQRIAAP